MNVFLKHLQLVREGIPSTDRVGAWGVEHKLKGTFDSSLLLNTNEFDGFTVFCLQIAIAFVVSRRKK